MYINDDLLASIGKESIQHLLRDLHKEFEVADNKAELFLVLQILREKGGSIALYQTDMFRTKSANPVAILADRHKDVGSHLSVVTSAVKLLSRYLQNS